MAVLIDGHLRLDYSNPDNPANDHLIFSKGHASPLYYAVLKAVGAIDDEELLTFRKLGSRLEGHPTPRIPPTDVATGSLGQGLPIGVGVAMAGRSLDKLPYRVWVLCGDSEMAEGSMWEAFQHAGWEGLDNLTAIIDVNRLGPDARDDARLGPRRLRAPDRGVRLEGDRDRRPRRGRDRGRLRRGRGHHRPADGDRRADQEGQGREGGRGPARQARQAARGPRGGDRGARRRARALRVDVARAGRPARRTCSRRPAASCRRGSSARRSRPARPTASRSPRWRTSAATSSRSTARSPTRRTPRTSARRTRTATSRCSSPSSSSWRRRSGCRSRGWTPFVSTFAAFLSRAYDFVRMGAISRAKLVLSGSHAGVSIGEDGPSQMALEDIASLRAIHGSTVLHPSDAQPDREARGRSSPTATASRSSARCAARPRCARAPDEDVRIGGSRIAHEGDDVAIIACGITLDEAVKAAERLADERRARPRARRLLDQADRRRGRPRRRARLRRDRHRRGPLRPRAASATPCSRRWPRATTRAHVVKLAVREIAGLRHAGGAAARARRSTPTRSPTRRQKLVGALPA